MQAIPPARENALMHIFLLGFCFSLLDKWLRTKWIFLKPLKILCAQKWSILGLIFKSQSSTCRLVIISNCFRKSWESLWLVPYWWGRSHGWNSLEAGASVEARTRGPCSATPRQTDTEEGGAWPHMALHRLLLASGWHMIIVHQSGTQEHMSARGTKRVPCLIFLNPNSRE